MKTRAASVLGLAVALAALAYALVLYPALPEQIPIHWNLRGEVDGWADKRWAAFLMPGFMALFVGGLYALPAMSPERFSVDAFRGTFNYVLLLVIALFGFIHVVMLQAGLHPEWASGRVLVGGILLFLGLMGNVLGRVRRNFWIGFRTPWTLASERVWDRTHRLAARLLFATGLAGAAAVWLGAGTGLWFALLMLALLVPLVYSYLLYQAERGAEED